MSRLTAEYERLLAYLDELTDLSVKRINFIRCGALGKAKFIDERIEPVVWQKINKQGNKINNIFQQLKIKNKNEKN